MVIFLRNDMQVNPILTQKRWIAQCPMSPYMKNSRMMRFLTFCQKQKNWQMLVVGNRAIIKPAKKQEKNEK